VKEAGEVFAVAFVADGHAPVAGELGDGAFDLPPVPAEAIVSLDAAAGDPRDDASFAQPSSVNVVVVALVGAKLSRLASAWFAPGLRRRKLGHQWLQHRAVVGVRSGHTHDQWDSICFGQDVDLRSLLAAVDGTGPVSEPPIRTPKNFCPSPPQ